MDKKTTNPICLLLVSLLGILSNITAQAPDWLWSKAMSGPSWDYGLSIANDPSGNVILVGEFRGTIDFDPGPGVYNMSSQNASADMYISKLDAAGNFIWAKRIGGSNFDRATSVAIDSTSGNICMTGYFEGVVDFDPDSAGTFPLTSAGFRDIFVLKLSNLGNLIWVKQMAGKREDQGFGITVDGSGNIYATGNFRDTTDFDPGPGIFKMISSNGTMDIFVCRLDSSGNFTWAKHFSGATMNDIPFAITHDLSGHIYSCGSFGGQVDFNPDSILTGNLTSAGNEDAYVSVLDSSGNFVRAFRFGGTGLDVANALTIDKAGSGDVCITGYIQAPVDLDPGPGIYLPASGGAFILKLAGSGSFAWAKVFGNSRGNAIAVDPSGSGAVYNTGIFYGTIDFNPDSLAVYNLTSAGNVDIYLTKLDSSGAFEWAKSIGGINYDISRGILLDAFSHVFLTGDFRSPFFTIGQNTFINPDTNTHDIFIAKLDNIVTGIEEAGALHEIFIYPNPAREKFTVSGLQFPVEKIELYNLLGEKLFEKTYPKNTHDAVVDVSQLRSSMYFLKISGANNSKTLKFIKE